MQHLVVVGGAAIRLLHQIPDVIEECGRESALLVEAELLR
jgi:hypothetical protein